MSEAIMSFLTLLNSASPTFAKGKRFNRVTISNARNYITH